MSVKHKAISSTLWTLVRILLDQVFSFLVFVVIARLLGPAEVGLFALGMIIAEVGRIISVSGFSDAVTKALPDQEEDIALAAFWGNMMLGLASAIVLTALAYPFALLVKEPRLAEISVALAWTVPVSAGYAVHQARQLKRFGHKSLAIRSLVAGVIGGSVAIAAAYAGAGVWALVIQRVLTELIALVTIWRSFRWIPSLRRPWARLKEILPFSSHMSASKLVDMLMNRFQDLVIGSCFSVAGVGSYRVAKRTIDMMTTGTLTSFSAVSVNVLAAVQQEKERLRAAILRVIAVSATVSFPVFIGLGVTAGDLLPLIYGEKWRASVPLFQLLTPVVVPGLFALICMSVLTIQGEGKIVSRIVAIQCALTIGLSLIGAHYGIEGVIIAFLARCYLVLPYQMHLVAKHTGTTMRVLVDSIVRPLIAALLMGGLCWAALVELQGVMPWVTVRLTAVGALGMIVYAGALWAIDRQSLIWLMDLMRAYVGRNSGEIALPTP